MLYVTLVNLEMTQFSDSGCVLSLQQEIDSNVYLSISSYTAILAYGQSKLANILHANELARHFKVHYCLLSTEASHSFCHW